MTFTHTELRAVAKRVHRLGLALNYGIDAKAFDAALERGVNYIYYTKARTKHLLPSLKAALAKDRERYVVVGTPTFGYFGRSVRSGCEQTLKKLGVDYLDVYQLGWVGVGAALTDATVEALLELKREGKVKAVGISIHNRPRAGRLAEDSQLDLFMIRYNAAHPGAERDIFPHLEKRKPSLIAYTATSWGKLLKPPRGWSGRAMTAGDCYRFCLSNPHVDVALTGPANLQQLEENLAAVERGPLNDEELKWMRDYGQQVHG